MVILNVHRKDAQLAYSMDIALQNELTMEEGIKQHTEYVLDENGERIKKPNGKYKTIAVSETGWNDPVN